MSFKTSLDRFLGRISVYTKRCAYNSQRISQQLGGSNRKIQYPFYILGSENFFAEDNIYW